MLIPNEKLPSKEPVNKTNLDMSSSGVSVFCPLLPRLSPDGLCTWAQVFGKLYLL